MSPLLDKQQDMWLVDALYIITQPFIGSECESEAAAGRHHHGPATSTKPAAGPTNTAQLAGMGRSSAAGNPAAILIYQLKFYFTT